MRLLKKLQTAQSKYEAIIGDVKSKLATKIQFDFSIQWQPSDGWTIVSNEQDVAPFEDVIRVIKQKGYLSYDDYERLCI